MKVFFLSILCCGIKFSDIFYTKLKNFQRLFYFIYRKQSQKLTRSVRSWQLFANEKIDVNEKLRRFRNSNKWWLGNIFFVGLQRCELSISLTIHWQDIWNGSVNSLFLLSNFFDLFLKFRDTQNLIAIVEWVKNVRNFSNYRDDYLGARRVAHFCHLSLWILLQRDALWHLVIVLCSPRAPIPSL